MPPRETMRKFGLLFEPFEIDSIILKNRIAMSPLFTGYAREDGFVSPLMLEHYGQIARGGAAMIVVANCAVDKDGALSKHSLRADDDRFVPGLKKLAENIKREKCAAVLQLNHGGRFALARDTLSASAVPIADINLSGFYKIALQSQELERKWSILSDALEKKAPAEMTPEDIRRVFASYSAAARRAKSAGFDMVEIHGATGYLPVQFLSPRTNLRSDRYGGDAQNRMRFCLELLQSVRNAVGEHYPVGWRFLADEWMPGGFCVRDARIFARRLERDGIAYLSVTAGVYESFSLPEIIENTKKPCYVCELSKAIKNSVKTPVIATGRIVSPELAEQVLERKDADMVGLARSLLVDPDWPEKARSGNEKSIKTCKNCGACFKMVVAGRPVICPEFDRHKRLRRKQALREMRNINKKVLIAMDGSDNAAMAAAYVGDMLCGADGVRISVFHVKTEETSKCPDEILSTLATAKRILVEKNIAEEAVAVVVKDGRKGVAQDILDEIAEGGYGTVVVGRRGLSMARRLLFGSVSDKIVRNAKDCTVWVVD